MARLLLVDDDPGWLALYRLELAGGHEILEAPDVLGAFEQIKTRAPDLVVLDYHLPGLPAPALLEMLRARGLRVPVVLCTGDPARASREQCDAVVSKHTDLRRLRRTIDAVLAARHASDPGRAA